MQLSGDFPLCFLLLPVQTKALGDNFKLSCIQNMDITF